MVAEQKKEKYLSELVVPGEEEDPESSLRTL